MKRQRMCGLLLVVGCVGLFACSVADEVQPDARAAVADENIPDPTGVVLPGIATSTSAVAETRSDLSEVVIGKKIPDSTRIVLAAIATSAGEKQIEVSSVNRTPSEQIRISISSYGSAEKAKAVYGAPCRDAFSEKTQAEMVRSLEEILDASPRPNCMRHVGGEGKIIDVKPSSVANHKAFYEAVIGSAEVNTERFYYPDIAGVKKSRVKDAAFHIELN